jgi:phenylpropionate dioxygenase-like ring-hydroxylating dioxygenase large terminal subunit
MSVAETAKSYDHFYTHEFPQLGTGPVSVESYVSAAHFELERRHIFRKSWLLFCHVSEIPNPGDYKVKDIAVLGISVIVVRGTDGVVRAFHNVCRHRGSKMVFENGNGNTKAFVCRMHGWAYGLDGGLRGVPERDRFFDLEKKRCGLPPVSIDTWSGFFFIHAQARPGQSLREYLVTLADDMNGYPYEQMRVVAEYTATLKANWKVVLNVFQEAYHVATVHRTVVPTQANVNSGSARFVYFRLHGPHRSASLPMNPEFQRSPTEKLAGEFSLGFSTGSLSEGATQAWPGMNPARIANFAFDLNVIFPSSVIDPAQGWFFSYEFWPVSVAETVFVTKVYFEQPKTWGQRIGQEFTIAQVRDGLLEDLAVLEPNQQALMSGAIDTVLLSDQELAIRHQHHVIDSIISSAAAQPAPEVIK